MKTAQKMVKLILACLCAGSMSCGGTNSNLEVTVVPTSAVLIPAGTAAVNGGYFSLTGPYFTLTSINLNWKGTGTLTLLAININMTSPSSSSGTTTTTPTTPGTGSSSTSTNVSTCSFGGDDIKVLFPGLVNASGVAVITQGQTVQASGPLGCSGLTTPTPIPSGYTIQATMQVIGASIDSSGNTTGRVTGTANITIQ